MKRTVWMVSSVLLALLFLSSDFREKNESPRIPPVDEAARLQDDPHGRRDWEFMRTRDPVTGRVPPNIHAREAAFASRLPRRAAGSAFGGSGQTGDKIDGWTYRGPWNVGGRTRAVGIDVSDPNNETILAGGVSGGLWRTTDDGTSWNLMTGSSQLHNVTSLAQDTRTGHQHVWFYGTGEGRGASTSQGGDDLHGDGIFKSTDGGLTWNVLPSTSTGLPQEFDNPFNYVWRILVDPDNMVDDVVYAATWGVIYRSVDGGATWTAVLGDPGQLSRYTDIIIDSNGVLYATLSSEGGTPGIYRSTDGLTWADITPAGIITDYGRIVLDSSDSSPAYVYFLVAYPGNSSVHQFLAYHYESGDGSGTGGTWVDRTAVIDDLPNPFGGSSPYWYNPQRGYNMLVDVHPVDDDDVVIGGVHLWRNLRGFSNSAYTLRIGGWYYRNRSHHADVHTLVRLPGDPTTAYTGSDGGVHKTTNLTSSVVVWQSLNNGYNTSQFYKVALDQQVAGHEAVLGGTQDNGTLWTGSPAMAGNWTEVFGGDGADCAVLDGPGGDYLVSYYFGNIYRILIDAAGNEIDYARVNHDMGGDYLFINSFLTDPEVEETLYLPSSNGIWRHPDVTTAPWGSSDPYNTGWEHLTTQPAGDYVSALGANALPGHALYYGTAEGGLFKVDDVLAATAGMVPENLTGQAPFPSGAYLSNISVHPDDGDKVLLCFGNYSVTSLWYTEDGGDTWTDVEGNLAGADGPSVRAVEIIPCNDADLWVIGTSTGIYSAVPMGPGPVNWALEAPDAIGNVVVDDFMYRAVDRRLAVGTHGRGIWQVTVPVVSDVPEVTRTALRQNVPNPFNPRTEIAYDLPEEGTVRLVVYDLKGRQVKVLADGHEGPGSHVVTWDGTSDSGLPVAAGVYVYQLETGGVTEQRKMTLVR